MLEFCLSKHPRIVYAALVNIYEERLQGLRQPDKPAHIAQILESLCAEFTIDLDFLVKCLIGIMDRHARSEVEHQANILGERFSHPEVESEPQANPQSRRHPKFLPITALWSERELASEESILSIIVCLVRAIRIESKRRSALAHDMHWSPEMCKVLFLIFQLYDIHCRLFEHSVELVKHLQLVVKDLFERKRSLTAFLQLCITRPPGFAIAATTTSTFLALAQCADELGFELISEAIHEMSDCLLTADTVMPVLKLSGIMTRIVNFSEEQRDIATKRSIFRTLARIMAMFRITVVEEAPVKRHIRLIGMILEQVQLMETPWPVVSLDNVDGYRDWREEFNVKDSPFPDQWIGALSNWWPGSGSERYWRVRRITGFEKVDLDESGMIADIVEVK